ncbi:hypothetical protein B0H16DRAFT_1505423 [Mycena metata]|uniref:F-box domain-containing protein n=1 Tax=Mycena metata TaxID=1033252 RepID=A0AAD7K5F0_9AGAR|nr:hypothetical protein B0H16DRAFT_1505423 [Mycena metata]
MVVPALPTDIILVILKYIGVKDLMRLRQTCKDFLEITQLRSVWQELLQTEVIQRNIPIPRLAGRNLAALTSKELESSLSDALRLRKNWISPSPVPTRRLTFKTVHQPQSQIVSVAFLPGREHRWLMSLALTTGGQRLFTLQCWDLTDSTCVARRSLQNFRGFRINTESSHPAVLALRSPIGIEILGLDLSGSSTPDSAFITLQVLDNVPDSLHVFSGSTLLTKLGDSRVNLRTIEKDFHVELRNPDYIVQKECIDALLADKYAVVVRTVALELYSLSSFRDGSADQIIEPVCAHTWQWRVDSVSLAYQPSWEATARALHPPINILVRYASLFPWPVNALHHYVLPCDASYNPRDNIDANNKPYLSEAVLIRTFASPIRLFARWDMVLGSYGTALWIDSHTEDYYDHAVEGQRLAGTLFSAIEPRGGPAVALDDQTATATASMVYQVREDDGWVRIAIQEEEGRIAVGTSTAEITIFEYI